jgi:hypothetical protein
VNWGRRKSSPAVGAYFWYRVSADIHRKNAGSIMFGAVPIDMLWPLLMLGAYPWYIVPGLDAARARTASATNARAGRADRNRQTRDNMVPPRRSAREGRA